MGRKQIRCHGDAGRFEAVADLVVERFYGNKNNNVHYIADVAGGQGVLSRILTKKYSFASEVIDPRIYGLKGVAHRQEYYTSEMADFYDLIVGLHPDGALRPVVESSLYKPTILIPCCNYWSTTKIGLMEMIEEIEQWYQENNINFEKIDLNIKTPYKKCFITFPKGYNL